MRRRFIYSILLLLCAYALNAEGIRTAAELVAFVEAINGGQPVDRWKNEAGEVCLEADIDMAKVKKMQPIATFGGVFDGKGHSLMNWKARNGLIDCLLQGGVVRNLTIDGTCSMKAGSSGKEYCLGFIVNRNHGLVENCVNKGSIAHKSPYAEEDLYIGGVVGSNRWLVVRCSNYGSISSSCVSSHPTEGLCISLGGVVGGGYRKTEPKPSVSWCDNHGTVTYGGDMPCVYAGGVTGCMYGATLKYCINRGDVNVVTAKGETPAKGLNAHVGGVCAFSKGDVIGCDNFADVSSAGSHASLTAGIIAFPHTQMVVADCRNFGKVTLSNEQPSSLGGIVGKIGRPVHVSFCENFGEVSYMGYSPDRTSAVGGIVGEIYTKNDYRFAAYLRGCVNHGTVFGGSGGNNYANDRAIHTGGIAGRTSGNQAVEVVVRDCENRGKVTSVTGRRSDMIAGMSKTKVEGQYRSSYAESAEPLSDGSNVFGKVVTETGKPVSGVVVSDGLRCVVTGEDGSYSMTSDLDYVKFVQISLPSGYKAPSMYSFPQIFKRLRRHEKAVKADFVLAELEGNQDEYTVIMIGDPQMRGLGFDDSGERFRDVVMPDIEKFIADKKNVFAVNLGDLVYNWMHGYDDYVDICSKASFPIFNVPGNHDFDQSNLYDIRLATPFFESYISPTYYSFNVGDIHYVVLNTIMADPMNPAGRAYTYGITDDELAWLENDLKHVPHDKTLAICTHALLFQNNLKHREKHYRNFKEFKALIQPYSRIYSWAGHSHDNYGCEYAMDGGRMTSVTVARCNGVLRSNREIDINGTPNGYMAVSVKGGEMSWYYKAVGMEQDHQLRIYSPLTTGSEYVKAAIWNHTDGFWTAPQWYENGVLVGEMERVKENDPAYAAMFESLTGLTGRALDYATPKASNFLFRIKPTEGVRKGEIRVTDNFGVTYTQSIEW